MIAVRIKRFRIDIFIGESFEQDNVRVIRAANPVCRRMTERGKVINPEYSTFRDQPIPGASPLRINTLLYGAICRLTRTAETRNSLCSDLVSRTIQFSIARSCEMHPIQPRPPFSLAYRFSISKTNHCSDKKQYIQLEFLVPNIDDNPLTIRSRHPPA